MDSFVVLLGLTHRANGRRRLEPGEASVGCRRYSYSASVAWFRSVRMSSIRL